MSSAKVLTAGLSAIGLTAALAQAEPGAGVAFTGSYKNLLVSSTTVLGGADAYTLDLNRLRLEWKGQVSRNIGVEVQYDNEILAGSYLATAQARLEERRPATGYWHLESTYARGSDYLARHRVRRAAVTLSAGATDVKLGRQRVAWGTGRFWSPLDLLNPPSPTALEPGEREGVDAVLVEHKRSPLSRLSAVHVPAAGARHSIALAQWHGNAAAIDYSVTAGRVPEGRLLGLDLAGQIGGAGVRGEWTVTQSRTGGSYQKALVGVDYAFANTLTVSAEAFYDGSGSTTAAGYDSAGVLAGQRQTVARRYVGLFASYELTPLLKWSNWLARNMDDRSWYFSPRLTWSMRTDLDLSVGTQLFGGSGNSEFGQRKALYFASAQWFF